MTEWILYNELSFEPLTDRSDLSGFYCSEEDLNAFLRDDALSAQRERWSSTKLAIYQGLLVGFFTLVNDSITVDAIQETDRHPAYEHSKYPAIKIARLATHSDFDNRGIGTNMILRIYSLVYQISKNTGCCFVTVDSKNTDRALRFYSNKGFVRAILRPRETIPMYINFNRWATEEEEALETTLSDF